MSSDEVGQLISNFEELRRLKHGRRKTREFQRQIIDFFACCGRSFPWRETHAPYKILVSEVMLQQTQTQRVVVKYTEFLEAFPSVRELAAAADRTVLQAWDGLGYYRRALNLKRTAVAISSDLQGQFPQDFASLCKLPGIGPYTAAALCNFAFNCPTSMIETNIRTVYLHIYFHTSEKVADSEIANLVEETMERSDPRRWFYALMDLGAVFKARYKKINHKSAHHTVQSRFAGSHRQKRAQLVKFAAVEGQLTIAQAVKLINADRAYTKLLLEELLKDGFLVRSGSGYRMG